MALAEIGIRRYEELVIHNSSAKLAVKALVTFPLPPLSWSAIFKFYESRIPAQPANRFINGLEGFGIAPFTFLSLKFDKKTRMFISVPSYPDQEGLREITDKEADDEIQPHYFSFTDERQEGFEHLKESFLASLVEGGYVIANARIFPGTHNFNGYVSVSTLGVGLYGNLGVPLREGSPITGGRAGEVRDWFERLRVSSTSVPTQTLGTLP